MSLGAEYNSRISHAAEVTAEASLIERAAISHDRHGSYYQAIKDYLETSNKLQEALTLLPSTHPDVVAITQHRSEVESRILYLKESLDQGVATNAMVDVEEHIKPAQLTLTAGASHLARTDDPTMMGAAAAVGGLGGLLLLGPLGLVAGAAGAAYAATRTDEIGAAARTAGIGAASAAHAASEFSAEHGLSEKARALATSAVNKAAEVDEMYHVTENFTAGVNAAKKRMSEMNEQYKVTETVNYKM